MRATLVDELPEGPEWLYQVKWDGYRALAAKHSEDVPRPHRETDIRFEEALVGKLYGFRNGSHK
jgi:hypothetical protein